MSESNFVVTVHDYDGEKSLTTFRNEEIDGDNIDEVEGLFSDLLDGLNGVSLGLVVKTGRLGKVTRPASGNAASYLAQRQNKWLVRMTDDVTGRPCSLSIAAPDLSLLVPNSNLMDISAGAGLALVSAVEAGHLSVEGNAVSVVVVVYVGRNV